MVRRVWVAWMIAGCLTAGGRDFKAFFQERCAACHGSDGTGKGPGGIRLGGRNWREGRWLAKQGEADLVASLLHGRGAMPGYRRQLSEAEAREMVGDLLEKAPKTKLAAPSKELPR